MSASVASIEGAFVSNDFYETMTLDNKYPCIPDRILIIYNKQIEISILSLDLVQRVSVKPISN